MMPPGRMVRTRYLPLALGLIAVSFLAMSYYVDGSALPAPRVRQTVLAARFAAVAPPGEPAYLAVQPSGGLVIGDRVHRTVALLPPEADQVRSFGPDVGPGETLADVAGVAASGPDIFVVDRVRQRIVHIDAMGRLVGSVSFQALGTYGAGPLAVDAQGTFYLADTGRGRILVLGPDGALRMILGTPTNERPGQLKQPMGVALAPDGALYVADVEARRIAWWRPNLDPGGDWPTEFAPWGVSVDTEGRVYVPDPATQRVHVYSSTGRPLVELDEALATPADLEFPGQAALSPDGSTLWVVGHNGLLRMDLEVPRRGTSSPSQLAFRVAGIVALLLAVMTVAVRAGRSQRIRWRWSAAPLAKRVPRLDRVRSSRFGLVAWSLALWLALAGQVLVVTGRPVSEASPLHLAACAVGVLSVAVLPAWASPVAALRETAPAPGRLASLSLLAGVLLIVGSVWLTVRDPSVAAGAMWFVGLMSLLFGCLATDLRAVRANLGKLRVLPTAGLTAIVALAFVLRVVNLAQLPPQVHGDEGAVGIEARKLLGGEVKNLFGLGWFEIPNLSFAIPAAAMRLFGNDLFGLRLASVVQGTLTVLVTFLLVRRLCGSRVATIATFLLAVMEMHVHYSRIGVIYMQAGLATVLLLYLMLRALERRRSTDYVLLGLVGGLSLVVYAAARIAPVLVGLYVLHTAIRDRSFLRTHLPGLVVAALAGLLILAPMGVVYAEHPAAFNVRTGEISVLGGPGLGHELSAYGVSTLNDVLRIQTQNTFGGFLYSGDSSEQYGHRAPLVDPWTGALLVAGFGAFGLRFRHPTGFLLGTWTWLTLILGSVLTVDAPFSPHLVGMLPLLAILPALFVDAGWRAAERLRPRVARPVFTCAVTLLLALALAANVRDYLEVHVVQLQPAGFATVLGNFVRDKNDRYTVYLISRPDTSLRYDSTRFLAPDVDGVDLRDGPLGTPRPSQGKGLAFIVEAAMPAAAARVAELRQRYPSADEQVHRSTRGDVLFTSFLVAPS